MNSAFPGEFGWISMLGRLRPWEIEQIRESVETRRYALPDLVARIQEEITSRTVPADTSDYVDRLLISALDTTSIFQNIPEARDVFGKAAKRDPIWAAFLAAASGRSWTDVEAELARSKKPDTASSEASEVRTSAPPTIAKPKIRQTNPKQVLTNAPGRATLEHHIAHQSYTSTRERHSRRISVVCLEDGLSVRNLERHLRTKHNMSLKQYVAKWGNLVTKKNVKTVAAALVRRSTATKSRTHGSATKRAGATFKG